jgi:hypothetical protein
MANKEPRLYWKARSVGPTSATETELGRRWRPTSLTETEMENTCGMPVGQPAPIEFPDMPSTDGAPAQTGTPAAPDPLACAQAARRAREDRWLLVRIFFWVVVAITAAAFIGTQLAELAHGPW